MAEEYGKEEPSAWKQCAHMCGGGLSTRGGGLLRKRVLAREPRELVRRAEWKPVRGTQWAEGGYAQGPSSLPTHFLICGAASSVVGLLCMPPQNKSHLAHRSERLDLVLVDGNP